ncbi:GNAT family N-acetyltransferase [Megasphaera paucivorans]|uniref:Ribosomal protein S18 acetylase RimI n=1 Tax=Megasphaera paucivorans TaxID=349095 RepID=A0A1G9XSE3_9FIRM|nr:GNAT family N-acetyltransferase [Megasphaera paucivorans]SDM99749.1 Ribosomal protein S18 acetylase RimI [Megasphaera paucivorans]
MELRLAQASDINRIYEIIMQGRNFLKRCGVNQWQNGYPNKENIMEDIERQTGYMLCDAEKSAAYACIDFDGEPAYDHLRGTWLDQNDYAVIHRMAVDDSYKGQGLAKQFFEKIETFVCARGILSIRVDTDNDNSIMKHLIEKSGYVYCGTIWFDNSIKIAYQKQLGLDKRP